MQLELKQHLSKHDLVKLMTLSYRSMACNDFDELNAMVIDLKELFPYENAVCVQADMRALLRSDRQNLDMDVRSICYPPEYLDIYVYRFNFLKDAVFREFISSLAPVAWPSANNTLPCEVLIAAADLKIEAGWLHGTLAGTSGRITTFGFSGHSIAYPQRISKIMKYIIPFYAEAYQRIQPYKATPSSNLTDREKEVLDWMKEGKSSWEISVLFNCSKRNIDFHVNNIKKKLNVVSRAQAVAVALHRGDITF